MMLKLSFLTGLGLLCSVAQAQNFSTTPKAEDLNQYAQAKIEQIQQNSALLNRPDYLHPK